MKYIHTADDLAPFAGFLRRPEKPSFTSIIAGPDEMYGAQKTGTDLNQFPTQRIQLSIHKWPPGKAHGRHSHDYWEQCYYIFSGQALITVENEEKIIGAGGSAFMPAGLEHDIVAVGEEELVAAVVTCVLDDDKINEND